MMNTEPPHPSKYVMLDDNQNPVPPHQRRNPPPRYHQPHSKSGGNCCIKFICCCYCCLFFLIFFVTIITYILYALYEPHVPSYNVNKFEVAAFDVLPDFSFNTEILLTVKSDNPNDDIGFIYGKESAVNILYKHNIICTGKLPAFEQPKKNVSTIKVVLKGKSEFASGLQESLVADNKAGKVPLVVTVKAPITVVIGKWPLRQVLVKLHCSLVVDGLTKEKQIKILSTKYEYAITF